MSKVTISSLVRQAQKSEGEFQGCVFQVFEEEPAERVAEFFDKLNIPRSVEGETFHDAIPAIEGAAATCFDFESEHAIGQGIQKYMERHEKKLKWHAQHPSIEGARNLLLLVREGMFVTDLRLTRLQALLRSKDELTPNEWAIARELMNRGYLSFRNFLVHVSGAWMDAIGASADREEITEMIGDFYELIDQTVRRLEEHRGKIEERRLELTVNPAGFDPVKPPNYFGGDLLGQGPWRQFWTGLEERAHHFRESLA